MEPVGSPNSSVRNALLPSLQAHCRMEGQEHSTRSRARGQELARHMLALQVLGDPTSLEFLQRKGTSLGAHPPAGSEPAYSVCLLITAA